MKRKNKLFIILLILSIIIDINIRNSEVTVLDKLLHKDSSVVTERIIELVDNAESIKHRFNQLDELYNMISKELDIDTKYIKILYKLSNRNIQYKNKDADIFNEEAIKPISIKGASTIFNKKAEFIKNSNIKNRKSAYFLPDALYKVSLDIKNIIQERENANRGNCQLYYDTISEDVKRDICFYEAIMLYIGEKEDIVNQFYQVYETILYSKLSKENIVGENKEFKDRYLEILGCNGFTRQLTIDTLALAMYHDKTLIENGSIDDIRVKPVIPFKQNYASRENMMIAAMSLAGKVRYVWGGGHTGTCLIDGINPVWSKWQEMYPCTPYESDTSKGVKANKGFGTCIKPSGSWCPIHAESKSEYHGETVNTLSDYIDKRSNLFKHGELERDEQLFKKIDFSQGINIHTLDGLDCSGYASWLYNQLTDTYQYNSVAVNFSKQRGMKQLEPKSDLLPGDTFSWSEHIVIVVGKVRNNSKAYVTIEQTTNVLKFGVIYYSGATSKDIEYAKQIANEANRLICGDSCLYESVHVYCIDTVGIEEEEDVDKVEESENQEDERVEEEEDADKVEESENQEDERVEEEVILAEENKSDTEIILIEDNEVAGAPTIENDDTDEFIMGCIPEEDNVEESSEITYYLGRYAGVFEDDDTNFKNLTAVDIIQHTITKLPITYVSGYNEYKGNIFNKEEVGSNLGIIERN